MQNVKVSHRNWRIVQKLDPLFFSAKTGLAELKKNPHIIYDLGGKWARNLKFLSGGNPSFATSGGFITYSLEIRVWTLSLSVGL